MGVWGLESEIFFCTRHSWVNEHTNRAAATLILGELRQNDVGVEKFMGSNCNFMPRKMAWCFEKKLCIVNAIEQIYFYNFLIESVLRLETHRKTSIYFHRSVVVEIYRRQCYPKLRRQRWWKLEHPMHIAHKCAIEASPGPFPSMSVGNRWNWRNIKKFDNTHKSWLACLSLIKFIIETLLLISLQWYNDTPHGSSNEEHFIWSEGFVIL